MVEVCAVEKRYPMGKKEVWALRGVSFTVASGEFLALSGSSGSGKTTMLNLVGCLDLPSQGQIKISGKTTSAMSSRERAHFRANTLGFVFQTFNLLPVLSALENVEYPLLKRAMSPPERREVALAALGQVGLEKFFEHRPDQLSGGQRQRVAVARALVHKPELIIADEPTANLDKKTAVEVLDLMQNLNKTHKLTFIFASHDPLILSRATRVIELSDGQVIA